MSVTGKFNEFVEEEEGGSFQPVTKALSLLCNRALHMRY